MIIRKFEFYLFICKWKLHFSDTIINVKSNRLYIFRNGWNLRDFLFSKISYFERYGHIFSHISEMKITFITVLRNMTYKHYLEQPKHMVEWFFNKILAKNPEHVKMFGNISHLLIRKNHRMILNGEFQDPEYIISKNFI